VPHSCPKRPKPAPRGHAESRSRDPTAGYVHAGSRTFARIAIEHNRPIFWLSKHLGHSSLDVTSYVYGHFEKATRWREAEAMAGVFGV
jgi:hypothetical protein